MKQRDIYLANLNPAKGSEQAGTRPVVIISGETMNVNLPVRIVCPLSSRAKGYPACVPVLKSKRTGLKVDSEIITFQIRTISTNRLKKKMGTISSEELQQVFRGLADVFRH